MSDFPPFACLNGEFVPEAEAFVSIFDRAFLYGDGLFETLLVRHGRPHRWNQHLDRLRRGAAFLRISFPWSVEKLAADATELIHRQAVAEATLRITLSRGVGQRGYLIRGSERSQLIMTLHPAAPVNRMTPVRWRLITSALRVVANDPLARFKTANKLPQIVARTEAADRGADDALLLNTNGQVAETTNANLFWVEEGAAWTPPLTSSALEGVTRTAVLELCALLQIPNGERPCEPQQLEQADGVFLTLSSLGIVEVPSLDSKSLPFSPLTCRLHQALQELIDQETRP